MTENLSYVGTTWTKPKKPDELDRSEHIYLYIICGASKEERESGDIFPQAPFIVYETTLGCLREVRERQKRILETRGLQSFYTIGMPLHNSGAFS